ncbi:MAG: hypothetical protein PF517_09955 [Salinivirgaceae bacterium]|jgi:hypothetical protein|nr:hypothetical protein [Salinivirgaceae bacterium]
MKKGLLIIFIVFVPFLMYSQDLIIRSNGKIFECKIEKEDGVNLYFSFQQNGQKLNSIIAKNKIQGYEYNYLVKEAREKDSIKNTINYRNSVTIGILQGGGSLIGVDFESLITKRIGLQMGLGYVGIGGGIDFHLRPTIRSSFISLQYWYQGFGESHTQSVLGPCFVYRGKKCFTFQIGTGYALEKGPAWPSDKEQPQLMLTYAIGVYIPYK